jgi:uncharacterized membrane protein
MSAATVSTAWGERMLIIVLILVGELLAVGLTIQALVYPGWAYKQAHRSKVLWVLAGLVAFVPLLAYVVLVMWIIRGPKVLGAARPHKNGRQATQSQDAADWSGGKTVNVYVSHTSIGATPVYVSLTPIGATPVYVSLTSIGATPVCISHTSIGARPVYRVGGGPLG